ncbi:MoaD/ThiS family protein [Dermabacter sp. p3-SID358]|uniref:MoaD/ThiS family protein n=1 Tax=Dermabacter sp. p3-SID358 TaxID=2916114 RepID=UPI0021A96AEA|nr:MoaD/ThiS family protein [Dermabacter sp. p3-SID358]MCT1866828.1 MoaD/ThiS family protein [Dermabacter sp. p3-SID358]
MTERTHMKTTADVRFFAGAAHAFGTDSHCVQFEGDTLGDLLDALRSGAVESAGADAEVVLGRCSFLVNKVSENEPSAKLVPAEDGSIRVDVLPPFAGG